MDFFVDDILCPIAKELQRNLDNRILIQDAIEEVYIEDCESICDNIFDDVGECSGILDVIISELL